MADTFLRELFQLQNRVKDDKEQECIICTEDCGTINTATGLAEFAIRLPCKHIVGSGCIAQWLRNNNTCPVCRNVFFPAGSHTEHSVQEGHDDHVRPHRGHSIQGRHSDHVRPHRGHSNLGRQRGHTRTSGARTLREETFHGPTMDRFDYHVEVILSCDKLSAQLGLRPEIGHVAASIAMNLLDPWSPNALPNHDDNTVLAVSMYVACIITRHPRCPREISAVMEDVNRYDIPATYALLTDWRSIIDSDVRAQLIEIFHIRGLDIPLDRSALRARESDLEHLTTICSKYCDRLNSREHVISMARRIASRVWNIGPLRQTRHYPRSLAAACVFMAGHLMGSYRSTTSISEVSQVRHAEIQDVYRLLYDEREQIVQEDWLRVIGKENMRRALAMLPVV